MGRAAVSRALEQAIEASHLDPDVCVLRHVTRTSRLVVANFDAAFAPFGLSGLQFNALMTLARRGPLNVGALSNAVGMHSSTTPRLMAPLLRERLVEARTGADRRERVLSVTAKGRGRLLRAYPSWVELQARIVGSIGEARWSTAMVALKSIRKSLRR